jgi:hypothetical protein
MCPANLENMKVSSSRFRSDTPDLSGDKLDEGFLILKLAAVWIVVWEVSFASAEVRMRLYSTPSSAERRHQSQPLKGDLDFDH